MGCDSVLRSFSFDKDLENFTVWSWTEIWLLVVQNIYIRYIVWNKLTLQPARDLRTGWY